MEKRGESDDEKWMYVVDEFQMLLPSQTEAWIKFLIQNPISKSISKKAWKLTTNQNLGFFYPLPLAFHVLHFWVDLYIFIQDDMAG